MSVKSNYFKMEKEEFNNYLNNLKTSQSSIKLFNDKYFFAQSTETNALLVALNKKMVEFDSLLNSFTEFAKGQIVQSFLIDEIESTNKIENIYSTRHDIFSVISNASTSKDKKVISIANAYKQLLDTNGSKIESLKDVRELYDIVLTNSIEDKDCPDGEFFRKGPVFITDGFNTIHTGTQGEENINKEMNQLIDLYNSNNDIFIRMILCHFIFETVHPFYDGNGRLGRFLFSNGLYLDSKSYFAFAISSALEREKDRYYKAFKAANDKYEFGCLNEYIEIIIKILINQIDRLIEKLNEYKIIINNSKIVIDLTKSEKRIYTLILEASLLSDFGISNDEIIEETKLSKRTVIYALKKFKKENILIDIKVGVYTFHKFSI